MKKEKQVVSSLIFVAIFQLYFSPSLFAHGNQINKLTNQEQNKVGARHTQGHATGDIVIQIVDSALVKTNHTYRFTFQDTILEQGNRMTQSFTLKDTTLHIDLITEAPLVDSLTMESLSYTVDGFQFSFQNPQFYSVNEDSSGWNNPDIYDFSFEPHHYSNTVGYAEAADYQIEFGSVGIDSSIELQIASPRRVLSISPVNFRVKNLTSDKYIHFGFWERDLIPGEEGMFSGFTDRTRSDEIIFVDDSLKITWRFKLANLQFMDSTKRNPKMGDVVKLILDKPFSNDDIFDVTMPDNVTWAKYQHSDNKPHNLLLQQNYPNPFNPVTTIKYSLPKPDYVTLSIYNLAGVEVAQLVDGYQQSGHHQVIWDANDKPSGVYLCKLRIGAISSTRKMLLKK